jgi:hypothetical protein
MSTSLTGLFPLTHLKTRRKVQQNIVATWSSHDCHADRQVLNVVGDSRVVGNLRQRDGDFRALMERGVDFVEDSEWRLRGSLVSVLKASVV